MNWFRTNSSLENVSLIDLANAVNNPNGQIQLPPFQRDAVWDEKHIELLWDSILRKFPIGSLLFARASEYNLNKIGKKGLKDSIGGESKKISKTLNQTEFLIIDGQQRLISISLGYREWKLKDSARLWIDLGNKENDKEDKNFLYRFYVCSNRKPWGLNATTNQIRDAMTKIKKEQGEDFFQLYYDFDKKDADLLNKTWPLRAAIPIPFNIFKKAVDDGSYNEWESLIPKHIPKEFITQDNKDSVKIEKITEIIKGINDYKIPLYLIKKMDTEDLGVAFQRINKQGVVMSDDDLFFSGLKMVWPDSHDLVFDVYDDIKTGKFLQPAGIVHNVIRLSAANEKPDKRSDILDLNLKEFKTLIDTNTTNDNKFFNKVKSYLEKDKTGRKLYHSYLLKAKQFLQFEPNKNPYGLPIPLLSILNKRVWHTLTAWIDKNREAKPYDKVYDETRIEMIRYAFFDHLYLRGTSTGIMSLPFKLAFESNNKFPGHEIYKGMIENNFFTPGFQLYTPEKFGELLLNPEGIPIVGIFNNENALVHWNQRAYLHKWFPDFDTTLYRTTEDLPYDVDHIIAAAHFHNIRGKDTHELFWKKIHPTNIINSPGNYRLWPKSLNRSDQDNDLLQKYILGDKDKEIKTSTETNTVKYLTMKPFEFITIGDVRAASFIIENKDDLDLWEIAANRSDVRNWNNQERIDAFIKVVQNRYMKLYTTLFNSLKWSEWLK